MIRDHGGTIDKFIGDEVMAYFGLSDVSDDCVCLSAVRAAWDIERQFSAWIAEAEQKLGRDSWPAGVEVDVKSVVHFGKVIWARLGTSEFSTVSVLTQEVIKAARIMQHQYSPTAKLVNPGEVWISADVQRRLPSGRVELGEPVRVQLRNFEKASCTVYRVRSVFDSPVGNDQIEPPPERTSGVEQTCAADSTEHADAVLDEAAYHKPAKTTCEGPNSPPREAKNGIDRSKGSHTRSSSGGRSSVAKKRNKKSRSTKRRSRRRYYRD